MGLNLLPSFRRLLSRNLLSWIPPLLGVSFSAQWANAARIVGVKLSSEVRAQNEKKSPYSEVEAGDVVVSNLTNVLEVCPIDHDFFHL